MACCGQTKWFWQETQRTQYIAETLIHGAQVSIVWFLWYDSSGDCVSNTVAYQIISGSTIPFFYYSLSVFDYFALVITRYNCSTLIDWCCEDLGSDGILLYYTLSSEYRVVRNRYSWLLFTSEDRLCANLRVQEQLGNMTSQCQCPTFAWRHRTTVVTSQY